MAAPSPLSRWKRFFLTFETIDAAIVASDPDGGRALIADAEDLRRFKADVVQFLCDAPDEELAEDYCKILDDLMVEYLFTLNKAAPVKPSAVASSTGVARAVAALQDHEYEQIRCLARETLARWRASGESDIADARAPVEELGKLSDLVPVSRAPVIGQASSGRHVAAADISGKKSHGTDAPPCRTRTARPDTANIDKVKTLCHAAPAAHIGKKMPVRDAPPFRAKPGLADMAAMDKTKTPCLAAAADSGEKTPVSNAPPCSRANPLRADTAAMDKTKTPAVLGNGEAEIAKMDATKRKLREGYKEHEDAKRQRRIQVIEAPKMMPEQRPRKVHPILRERSRARCGAPPAAVKRSLIPAFQRI